MFGLLATFALTAMTVLQVHAAPSAGCDRSYTVAYGDSCNAICAEHDVSSYQLAAANQGVINADCSNLYEGEVICLGLTGQDCRDTYVVQSGDSCTTIANQFNIPRNTLLTNNPILNPICTNLYPSEVLCVSSTIYVRL